jgi:hypothetical protein
MSCECVLAVFVVVFGVGVGVDAGVRCWSEVGGKK